MVVIKTNGRVITLKKIMSEIDRLLGIGERSKMEESKKAHDADNLQDASFFMHQDVVDQFNTDVPVVSKPVTYEEILQAAQVRRVAPGIMAREPLLINNPSAHYTVLVERMSKTAKLPQYNHSHDAWAEIFADEEVVIYKSDKVISGLAIDIPFGFELQIKSLPELARNQGIAILGGLDTISSSFKGLLRVDLVNLGSAPYTVKKGQAIAMIKIVEAGHWIYEDKYLDSTEDGTVDLVDPESAE